MNWYSRDEGRYVEYGVFGSDVTVDWSIISDDKELDVLEKTGFVSYFLIVWDLVNFCTENRILAQGRGSAANAKLAADPCHRPVVVEHQGRRELGQLQRPQRRPGPAGFFLPRAVATEAKLLLIGIPVAIWTLLFAVVGLVWCAIIVATAIGRSAVCALLANSTSWPPLASPPSC